MNWELYENICLRIVMACMALVTPALITFLFTYWLIHRGCQ